MPHVPLILFLNLVDGAQKSAHSRFAVAKFRLRHAEPACFRFSNAKISLWHVGSYCTPFLIAKLSLHYLEAARISVFRPLILDYDM